MFPILRSLVLKFPKLTMVIASLVYIVVFFVAQNSKMSLDKNLFVSMYGFLLGMYLVNIKEYKWWQMVLGFCIGGAIYFIPVNNIAIQIFNAKLSAYFMFFGLAFLGQCIKLNIVQKIFCVISKYSYSIYLVHHYIIMKVESTYQNRVISAFNVILIYLIVWGIIIICSKILYYINSEVLKFFKSDDKNKISQK